MKKDLPVFQFLIDDSGESGVKTISLVDDPAMMSMFIAFETLTAKQKYMQFQSNGYEQAVIGVALQPDLLVYRFDNEIGEYYGTFSKDTIKKIVYKFHKELQNNNVNLEHNVNNYINAFMFSDYIVDSDLQLEDLKNKGITDAKIGSWIVSYKIEDPAVFQQILDGRFTGLSVEAFLDRVFIGSKNKLIENNVQNMKKIKKGLKEKILAIFADDVFERALVPELAFEIEWGEVGQPVNKVIVGTDGTETLQPTGQGEFVTESGIVVTDEASNLVEVRDLPAEPVVEAPEAPVTGVTSQVTGNTATLAISGDTSAPGKEVSGMTGNVSGDTAMAAYPWDTCIADQLAAGYSQSIAEKICGKIKSQNASVEDAIKAVLAESGTTVPISSNGLNQTVSQIVGTKPGTYTVNVTVDPNGIVTEAKVSSESDLLMSKQKEIETLAAEKAALEGKLKEPIAEPQLQGETPAVDFSKMSQYEKMMYKKGLKPFKA